jgi:hypothetical protein
LVSFPGAGHKPSGLVVNHYNGDTLGFGWYLQTDATRYEWACQYVPKGVLVETYNESRWTNNKSTTTNDVEYKTSSKNLQPGSGASWLFRVKAINDGGESHYSYIVFYAPKK